jgi:hypothetical protein
MGKDESTTSKEKRQERTYHPYPRREHLKPEEAQAKRDLEWKAELKRIQCVQAASKAYAEEVQQALLNEKPVTHKDRSELDNIAYNIHNAYHWGQSDDVTKDYSSQCVTAVALFKDNRYRAFPQRAMLVMQEYAKKWYADKNILLTTSAPYEHMHAEMYVVYHFLLNGANPNERVTEIGVSKPICPSCKRVLENLAIGFNRRWITGNVNFNWLNPWRHLPKDFNPPVAEPEWLEG